MRLAVAEAVAAQIGQGFGAVLQSALVVSDDLAQQLLVVGVGTQVEGGGHGSGSGRPREPSGAIGRRAKVRLGSPDLRLQLLESRLTEKNLESGRQNSSLAAGCS